MGFLLSKAYPPYYYPTDTESDEDEEDTKNVRTEKHEEFLDIFNEDDRLRGCRVGSTVIPVGCSWTDRKTCTYYHCQEYNRLSSISCPESPFECAYRRCKEIPMDREKDYPDCCPRVECEPAKFNTLEELDALGEICEKDVRQCL